jgi:hypothetical protein
VAELIGSLNVEDRPTGREQKALVEMDLGLVGQIWYKRRILMHHVIIKKYKQ